MKNASSAAAAAAISLDQETDNFITVAGLDRETQLQISKRNLKIAWAYDQSKKLRLKPAARILLLHLADQADFNNGKVSLLHKEIAPATGLDSRQIRAMVEILVQKELLQPPRRKDKSHGNSAESRLPAAETLWGLQDAPAKQNPQPGAGQVAFHEVPGPTISYSQRSYITDLSRRAGLTWPETIAWLKENRRIDISGLAPNEIPRALGHPIIRELAPFVAKVESQEPKGHDRPGAEEANYGWEEPELPTPPRREEPREPAAVALWDQIKEQLQEVLPNHVYTLQIEATAGAALTSEELSVEVKDAENAAKLSAPSFSRELQKQLAALPNGPRSISFLLPAAAAFE